MRISELSARTGVTVATIKYYLREGLLPEGVRSSPTQATYDESHVERLRVIRALIESGVSVAETPQSARTRSRTRRRARTICSAPPTPLWRRPSRAMSTSPRPRASPSGSAGSVGCATSACSRGVARALEGLDGAGFTVPDDVMAVYLDSVQRIARAEIAGVPTDSSDAAVRYVVLGSVLVEPLLLALRRVAEQIASAERFGGSEVSASSAEA